MTLFLSPLTKVCESILAILGVVSLAAVSMAHRTVALRLAIPSGLSWDKHVPMRAVCFSGIDPRAAGRCQFNCMCPSGDRLQMLRIAARLVLAQVVKFQPLRDWSNEKLVGDTVRRSLFVGVTRTTDTDYAISVRKGSSPVPASSSPVDLDAMQQSLGNCFGSVWHGGKIPPKIVLGHRRFRKTQFRTGGALASFTGFQLALMGQV